MNHHSFLIKQAMLPLLAGSGLVGAGVGGLTAGFRQYRDPELEERRNTIKDILMGAVAGGVFGGIGGTLGAVGSTLLGVNPGAGGIAGAGFGGFAGGNIAARIRENMLKERKALETKKVKE